MDLTINNEEHQEQGNIRVEVNSSLGRIPIENAEIQISSTDGTGGVLAESRTDANGMAEILSLDTPPAAYSMTPSENQPYAEYNLRIRATGYEGRLFSGVQIFSGKTAIQFSEKTASAPLK